MQSTPNPLDDVYIVFAYSGGHPSVMSVHRTREGALQMADDYKRQREERGQAVPTIRILA